MTTYPQGSHNLVNVDMVVTTLSQGCDNLVISVWGLRPVEDVVVVVVVVVLLFVCLFVFGLCVYVRVLACAHIEMTTL